MRISDHIIPAALFTVGLGLVSALGFEGAGGQSNNVAPAVGVDVVPRASAVTAPALAPPNTVPTLAVPNMPGNNAGGTTMRVPASPQSRSIGPVPLPGPSHAMTAADAFRTGIDLLKAGDLKNGVGALEYAGEHGYPIAQWKLGRMFADGDQVGRDEARAFRYFQDFVENHSDDSLGTPQSRYVAANAFVSLGDYYVTGIANSAIKANPQRARDLFAYAASYFGDAEAQYRLGRMLLEGQGGPKDPWQGARWLKLAADKDHPHAQALLGDILLKGQVVPRQAALGLMYLTLARQNAPQDHTVAELHAAAIARATDNERTVALTYLAERLKGRRN
jgi:TPR repeat protein